MPLHPHARSLIAANLALIQAGDRPQVVSIGYLTATQHAAINQFRQSQGQPLLLNPEILFLGRHLFASRSADGYQISDMLIMVESALDETAIVQAHQKMTGILNPLPRLDNYGNQVRDLAVFELYARRPKAELLSVIPKGDDIKPKDLHK